MDALREIVKAHIRGLHIYEQLCDLERLSGETIESIRRRAELDTTCHFMEEVKQILEELEYNP